LRIEFKYRGVLRQNQFKDPRFLAEGEVERMYNLVTDKTLMKPVRRGGISQLSTAPAVVESTHQFANGMVIGKFNNGAIYKTTDGITWTSIATGGSSDGFAGMVMHDKMYLFNRSETPKVTDGSTVWDYGIEPPDTSDIKSSHMLGAGSMESGFYMYVLVYYTEKGQYSRPSRPFSHFCKTDGANASVGNTCNGGSSHYLRFDDLPTPPSDVHTVYVFRTKHEGSTFFYLKTITSDDSHFTDSSSDDDLDLSWIILYQWDVRKAKCVAQHRERLFIGNVEVNKIISHEMPVINIPSSPPSGYTAGADTSLTSSIGGSLTPGETYYYKVFYMNSAGVISDFAWEGSVTLGSVDGTVHIHNIPEYRDAVQVIQRGIISGTYKYTIQRTYSPSMVMSGFTDTGSELSLGNTIEPNQPKDYPSIILFSEIAAPEQLNALNYIQVKPNDGDEINAIIDYEESLLIFKRNSLHLLQTYGTPTNWQLKTLTDNVGCDNHLSVQRLGRNVYFSRNNEIFRFPDRIESPLSVTIQDTIDDMDEIYASAVSTKYNWYIALAGGAKFNYAIVYDEDIQSWYVFTFSGLIKSIVEIRGGTLDGTLLMLSSTKCGKYNESETQDFGSEIVTDIKFRKEVAEVDRLIRPIEINIQASSGAVAYLNSESYIMTKDAERIKITQFSDELRTEEIQLRIKGLTEFVQATIKANYPKRTR